MSTIDALSAEPPFLGESRIGLVDGLLAILDEAEMAGESQSQARETAREAGTRPADAAIIHLEPS